MVTEYTYRLTVCAPTHTWFEANQLACTVGEHADDVNTFNAATHTKDGLEYACIHTPVKDIILAAKDMVELPEFPHAVGVDRAAAYTARDWVLDGTIVVDFIPTDSPETGAEVLTRLGFSGIVTEDPTEQE